MSSALRSNPRFGWRPWLAAIVLAVLLHLPLLWLQLQRSAEPAEPTQMVELLLTPPAPIPVSPPSDWADDIELKWTLSGEPEPAQPPPQFEALSGLQSSSMALSSQLTGLAPRATEQADVSEPEPAAQTEVATAQTASTSVTPNEPTEPPEPEPEPEPPQQRTATDQAAPAPPNLDAAINAALAATNAVRETRPQAPAAPERRTAAAEEASVSDDAVARALAQTPAVRTPGELPQAAQDILTRPPPAKAAQTQAPTTTQQPPEPQPAQSTQQVAPPQQRTQADPRYQPDGAAGSFSSDRDAFFSNLAEHLFTVNDRRLQQRPYTSRQIIDVRFTIDRKGRVMRAWTPAPVQSPATDAAIAMIWAASPMPQLAPDMPQAVLELTFPVVVGQ